MTTTTTPKLIDLGPAEPGTLALFITCGAGLRPSTPEEFIQVEPVARWVYHDDGDPEGISDANAAVEAPGRAPRSSTESPWRLR